MKIDPCPFCGHDEVECTEHGFFGGGNGLVFAHCDSCGADGPPSEWQDDAIYLWNKRFIVVYSEL